MKPIRFLPGAEDDALAAFQYYEEQQPGLGDEFEAALDATLPKLEVAERHRQVGLFEESPIRCAPLPRPFPQRVIFVELERELLIEATEHPSRRPGYWYDRI